VTDFEAILRALSNHNVEYVVIGGAAMQIRGSAYVTLDLDLAYARSDENLKRLVEALTAFTPRLRVPGEQVDLPFKFDAATLKSGSNFTLSTTAGDLDLLGFVTGLGSYREVLAVATTLELFGYRVNVLSIEGLIAAKRSAGRKKDLAALPELEALLDVNDHRDSPSD
jgi:predicted nucleotidyltransferase